MFLSIRDSTRSFCSADHVIARSPERISKIFFQYLVFLISDEEILRLRGRLVRFQRDVEALVSPIKMDAHLVKKGIIHRAEVFQEFVIVLVLPVGQDLAVGMGLFVVRFFKPGDRQPGVKRPHLPVDMLQDRFPHRLLSFKGRQKGQPFHQGGRARGRVG